MRKLGCLIVLGMLYAGGHGLYVGVRNRSPQTMTCEAALKTPPTAEWVHLTGCRINLLDAVAKESSGKPSGDIYVPLRSVPKPGVESPRTARVVLATRDPEVVAVLTEMAALDAKDTSAFYGFLAKNAKRLVLDRDVRGMVRTGLENDTKVTDRLKALKLDLAPDVLVVNDGEEPSLRWSLTLLGGVVVVFLILGIVGHKREQTATGASGPPPLPGA